jgi:uncharacterized membrane protein YhiD involved in acid resistance
MNELIAEIIDLGGRVLLAAIVGVMISYRRHSDRQHQAIVQSHAYLAVAGALFIMIIGDHFERAIGLIGVATIIRYRYAIRNPRDAGTLIIALGLGMACGTGELITLAVIGAIFVKVIVKLLDLLPAIMPGRLLTTQNEIKLRITTTDPDATIDRLEALLRGEGIDYTLSSLERKRKLDIDSVTVEAQLHFGGDLDISRLTNEIADEHVIGIQWRQVTPTEYWT